MSALIVCLICDRQRHVFDPVGYAVCGNCGVNAPRIIANPHDWEAKDGLPKGEAIRRTYAGLKWIRDTKHFKPKWADARYRAIFGTWPPREIEDVPPESPTANLLRRISVDNQNWKKQKRAEERAKTIAVDPDPLQRIQEGMPSFMSAADWDVKL